jgi:hypothetical protein
MGKTQKPAKGCSNRTSFEAWQTNDVSLGSPQDRSGTASEVGQG